MKTPTNWRVVQVCRKTGVPSVWIENMTQADAQYTADSRLSCYVDANGHCVQGPIFRAEPMD